MILDQRQMTGPELLSTVEEVEAYWAQHAAEKGFRLRALKGDRFRELRQARKPVLAYVSDGRWVADCARDDCNSGLAAWPENPRGACLHCGTVYPIEFPAPEVLGEAIRVLLARSPEHRHWKPWEQTVDDLKVENVTRGLVPVKVYETTLDRVVAESGIPPEDAARVLRAAGVDPSAIQASELL